MQPLRFRLTLSSEQDCQSTPAFLARLSPAPESATQTLSPVPDLCQQDICTLRYTIRASQAKQNIYKPPSPTRCLTQAAQGARLDPHSASHSQWPCVLSSVLHWRHPSFKKKLPTHTKLPLSPLFLLQNVDYIGMDPSREHLLFYASSPETMRDLKV